MDVSCRVSCRVACVCRVVCHVSSLVCLLVCRESLVCVDCRWCVVCRWCVAGLSPVYRVVGVLCVADVSMVCCASLMYRVAGIYIALG